MPRNLMAVDDSTHTHTHTQDYSEIKDETAVERFGLKTWDDFFSLIFMKINLICNVALKLKATLVKDFESDYSMLTYSRLIFLVSIG